MNFGFWGTVPLPPGQLDGYYNRLVEDEVSRARRPQVACTPRRSTRRDEFWQRYNGEAYRGAQARRTTAAGRLPGLYEKCVTGR